MHIYGMFYYPNLWRAVASGVYLCYLRARDATNGTVATFTGKLSIVH